jgi:hypothetical protein
MYIQIADNLTRKHWKGNKICRYCSKKEIGDHLMFLPCGSVHVGCDKRGIILGEKFRGVKDFNDNFLLGRGNKKYSVLFFLLGATCWTLWLNKNDYIFNQKLISSARSIFF